MTVNYFIKCPICGTITRMRSPAGYLYKSVVRIHCGKCGTLLSGEFISDNKNTRVRFTPLNCGVVEDSLTYEFEGQASGELLTTKIIKIDKNETDLRMPHSLSPAMEALINISQVDFTYFIKFALHAEKINEDWDNNRTLFDLYLNKQYNLILKNFSDDALKIGYTLNSNYNIMRYVYFNYFNNYGGIFKNKVLSDLLENVNNEFYHLNKAKLAEFINYIKETDSLNNITKKIFDISEQFVKIIKYLIPAISVMFYKNPSNIDETTHGMSTCSFADIKNFYLDTFECLANLCYIVKGLDNIQNRGQYDLFNGKLTVETFRKLSNGSKIKALDINEKFSALFSLPTESSQLRNAIGHNDYEYLNNEQIIEFIPNLKQPERKEKTYLLNVALECIQQMKSSMILAFYVFELERYSQAGNWLPLHNLFYKRTHGQNHCPCGSGKKYNKCCKQTVDSSKYLSLCDYTSDPNTI